MKPRWLKSQIPSGKNYHQLKGLLSELNLHTVCEEAKCPNIADCWQRSTATIMIMGDICTRSCGFCAVKTGKPLRLDEEEPQHVAEALSRLKLKHVVITSVDRDDLPDGGARHFAKTIWMVKEKCPETKVEVLIPDFKGQKRALEMIFNAEPDVLNHNLETVASLQKQVRPQASYDTSLLVLSEAANAGLMAKSGLMLGLGESNEEIQQALQDLRERGQVSILTLGQYLRPTPKHLEIKKYYHPEEFEHWKEYALNLGFQYVASAPMVRSSYHADSLTFFLNAQKESHKEKSIPSS
ncbi:MAG: lipoyl synthase [Deltaproteobacteria bacterium]|nr:lipoyl synthase [Deltaproteobacteria bacterium]